MYLTLNMSNVVYIVINVIEIAMYTILLAHTIVRINRQS